jgi:hypothetical protein
MHQRTVVMATSMMTSMSLGRRTARAVEPFLEPEKNGSKAIKPARISSRRVIKSFQIKRPSKKSGPFESKEEIKLLLQLLKNIYASMQKRN